MTPYIAAGIGAFFALWMLRFIIREIGKSLGGHLTDPLGNAYIYNPPPWPAPRPIEQTNFIFNTYIECQAGQPDQPSSFVASLLDEANYHQDNNRDMF